MRLPFVFVAAAWLCLGSAAAVRAEDLLIRAFDGSGRLVFGTLGDGTNRNYRVEWAPGPSGPWSSFGGAGAYWLDSVRAAQGGSVTCSVPMCYRVVATRGDYLAVDLSGGTNASTYPVTYYRTLADVPGGPNSDPYKTSMLLLRQVPKGVFTMGSPDDELGRDANEDCHVATLTNDFYVGVFEVTQRQWELVMGNRPSYFNNAACYSSRPVERVSYDNIRGSGVGTNWPASNAVDADSFMGVLRAKTGLAFDLPTEAQWECACRAGTSTALNSGKNLESIHQDANVAEVARYFYNGVFFFAQDSDTSLGTAKSGSYMPNAWGLYDMHGNVCEWCLDFIAQGFPWEFNRVIRGGNWYADAYQCRSATRGGTWPYYNGSTDIGWLGLRVALPQ